MDTVEIYQFSMLPTKQEAEAMAQVERPLKVEIHASKYLHRNDLPKFALGQLVKFLDNDNDSVSVLCIQGLGCLSEGWFYLCESIALLGLDDNSSLWKDREIIYWMNEKFLFPLTADDESRLNQLEIDLLD